MNTTQNAFSRNWPRCTLLVVIVIIAVTVTFLLLRICSRGLLIFLDLSGTLYDLFTSTIAGGED
jgi:hypothetical protein